MSAPASTVFAGATVFDGTDFLPEPQDVVVADGRIVAIGPAGEPERPADSTVIDCTGATLTPGFIDLHVHVTTAQAGSLAAFSEPFSLQFFKAADHLRKTLHGGVTTARDAGGADAGVRAALETGLTEGPDLTIAVTIMSQTGGHGDGHMPSGIDSPMLMEHPGRPSGVADGVEEVRKAVRRILRAGADHIKICSTGGVLSPADDPRHSQFTQAEIEVIVEEAQTQGTYVMAHAQGTNGIKNALRAGVKTIEHGIYLDDEAIQMMKDAGAVLVPTLQAPRAVIAAADAGVPLPPVLVEKAKRVADAHDDSVRRAYEAGVTIAMGTDAGVGPHGENLEEIELLAAIGLTDVDALRAATTRAAAVLGREDIGTIAADTAADLVVLDGDLRETGVGDIRQRVRHVFKNGVQAR
ncbi:amidohydrolase family protein [Brevibacterium sp. BRM-1]|uniref:metal-dependent hydrolase family protein n=1 Tax=Brevibacterium sp. BRM-1 TaxID=2999062 RepID=UPI00227E208A|nr:amidohydrolase family protein [Brevibacterium sp. BRM-1]WAL40664.1 amidohydrolase family protein [Brevibacterium sp. BRM-1]